MTTNRDIVFVLKIRNEARAGIQQIARQLRSLQTSGGGAGATGTRGRQRGAVPVPVALPSMSRANAPDPQPVLRTAMAYNVLARAAQAAVAALGVRELIQLSDSYTNLSNRIRLVTDGEEELVAVRRRLIDMANTNRQDLESTADLYSRIARNAGELALSQNQVLSLTDTIGQAMVISGASAQSAQAALIQLGQGFSAGTLRGEELNSVLENAPRLAQAIAEGMGVTVGQLRRLGMEGLLTAQNVVQALQSQADAVAGEFAQMEITVAQGFTVLRNGLTVLVGSFSDASGAGTGLGTVLAQLGRLLSEESFIEDVLRVANTTANVFLTVADAVRGIVQLVSQARSAIQSTFGSGSFSGVWEAVGGLAAMGQRITGLIGRFANFAQFVGGLGGIFSLLKDVVADVFSRLPLLWGAAIMKMSAGWERFKAATAETLESLLTIGAGWVRNFVGLFAGVASAVIAAFNALPGAFSRIGALAMNALIEKLQEGVAGVVGIINTILSAVNLDTITPPDLNSWLVDVPRDAQTAGEMISTAMSEGFSEGFNNAQGIGAETLNGITNGLSTAAEGFRGAASEFETGAAIMTAVGTAHTPAMDALAAATAGAQAAAEAANDGFLDLNATIGEGAGAGAAAVDAAGGGGGGGTSGAAQAATDALELLRSAIQEQLSPVEQLRQEHEALVAAMAQYGHLLTAAEIEGVTAALARQSDVLDGGFGAGFRMGLEDYVNSMKTFSEDIAGFTTETLGGLGDMLTDFFLTGEMGFKEFADQAIRQLMRILVQQWIIAPLAGMLGGIGGGGGGGGFFARLLGAHTGTVVGAFGSVKMARSMGALPKYHTGGIGSGEQMAVVRKGEAIMPTTRLSDGTLGIRAQGGVGSSITNMINVTVDGANASASPEQQDTLGQNISRQIAVALQAEMAKFTSRELRPGGVLYKG